MGIVQAKLEVDQRKKVVVLGGGYAGTNVAKQLDPYFNVTIVDRQNFTTHSIGVLRAISDQKFAQSVIIPFDKLLKDGKVVQGEIKEVSGSSVMIQTSQGSKTLDFDYLVVATGSSSAFPSRPSATDAQEAIKQLEACNADITNANKVLIIGGGAVGVELAGEIKYAHPTKSVTLVHGSDKLCAEGLMDKFYSNLQEKLKKLSVDVFLNERVTIPAELQGAPFYKGKELTLHSASGKTFQADLIFRCTGTAPSTAHLTFFASQGALDSAGRIKVNDHLQAEGHDRIFALGDCCNTAENKQAYLAMKHVAVVVANIHAMAKRGAPAKKYTPPKKPGMLLPVGAKDGVADIGGTMLPTFVVVMVKSRDLFASNRWKEMGYGGVGVEAAAGGVGLGTVAAYGAVAAVVAAAAVALLKRSQ